MPNRKAANGSGTITQRSDGRWEAKFIVGYDPSTGKAIRKSFYGKTKTECAKKLRAATAAVDNGTYTETKDMKLSQWLETWLELYTTSIRPGTLRTYVNNVNKHIVPAIGGIKLNALKPHLIQKFIKGLEDAEDGLSAKSIRNVHGTLHKALEEAVRVEYIPKNPADKTILPKAEKPKVQPLSGEEINLFLHAIQDTPNEDLFFVALWTGMRLSEILGLQWSCVNFDDGTILVDKQLSWKRKECAERELVQTKNGKERRITPPSEVMKRLRHVKLCQSQWRLKAGAAWNNALDLVFTNEVGGCLPQTTVEHRFKRICKSIGLDRHFHDARHTFATEGIRLGIPIKTVSETLGHYSTAFTMDVYGHTTEQMQKEAASCLQNAIEARIHSA